MFYVTTKSLPELVSSISGCAFAPAELCCPRVRTAACPCTQSAALKTLCPNKQMRVCMRRVAKVCRWLAVGFGAAGAALVVWKLSHGVATAVRRKKLRWARPA